LETIMLRMTALATVLILGASGLASTPALADACSGRHHTGGTIFGAITGGVLGGAVSKGNGGAVVGGALLGDLAGNAISRDMDCADHPYAVRSYNESLRGPVGQRYGWNRGPNRGYIVTHREYRRYGRLCRDFTQVVYRRGREFDRKGTACLRRDGEWEFV
jgi:surface antigen